jgi:hypothetical protein
VDGYVEKREMLMRKSEKYYKDIAML